MTRKKFILLAAVCGAGLALSGCATTAGYNAPYNPTPFTAKATVINTAHTPGQYVTTSTVYNGYILNSQRYKPESWDVYARTDNGYMVRCSIDQVMFDALQTGSTISVKLAQKSATYDFECLEAKLPL